MPMAAERPAVYGDEQDTAFVSTSTAIACAWPAPGELASLRRRIETATGLIARGSVLTSSFNASTGNYVLVARVPITACAVIATRGSVNTSVPFTPATVEITRGPARNTVGLQVRNLLFFGGDLLNEAFHAAAVC